VIGLLLVAGAAVSALLAAVSLRLPSLVSTLLASYLALVANFVLAVLVLSPFREVNKGGLLVAEALLLAGAFAVWWWRGRPGFPLASAGPAAREMVRDPLTALLLALVAAVLLYELVLALTVPPLQSDPLVVHLARAAAWAQHGGYFWIPNAPTVRLNQREPLAELEVLFLFVAAGTAVLQALPQYLAELALLVAVYGSARRLGFEARAAACTSALLATFFVVFSQATTAYTDLVAASFPAVAACLLLGGGRLEAALAGAAVGIGLGAKLTTALVLPILAWLALLRGRRAAVAAGLGALVGFAALGIWGYAMNVAHIGHPIGAAGDDPTKWTISPSYPASVKIALWTLYTTLDLSGLSDRLIYQLAAVGLLGAVLVAARAVTQQRGIVPAAGAGARVALPFLAPLFVIGAGRVIAWITLRWGFPVRTPSAVGSIIRGNDFTGFGAIGDLVLLGAPVVAAVLYLARRVDARQLALALAVPSFLILLALHAQYDPSLPRFLLVPAGLSVPLFAHLVRGRAATAAYLVVAALLIGTAIRDVQSEPLSGPFGHPWNMTLDEGLLQAGEPKDRLASLEAYEVRVPAHACVGAVLDIDDPSFLLWGPQLQHRVFYLPVGGDAVTQAYQHNLSYVVITTGLYGWVADSFTKAGWAVQPLATTWSRAAHIPASWNLAVAPWVTSGKGLLEQTC
jgi:hypothetical protein